jgi:hypothetical protein
MTAAADMTTQVGASDRPAAADALRRPSYLAITLLVCIYAGLWLYVTPYVGMGHDAQAYAVQGKAVGDAKQLAGDLFLAYRSQEEFTIFPSIYGWFIDTLGLDHAAALLTLTCQAAWFAAAFLVIRQLAGVRLALLALGLLLTVPGNYGGLRVFSFAEGFLTARLPAEVLSLLAIWFALKARTWLAALVVAVALALHPLMAFPAAIWIAFYSICTRNRSKLIPALSLAGIAVAVAGSYVIGGSDPVMDGRWLAITEFRSGFLFLTSWKALDWNYTLESLLTLTLGACVLRSESAGRVAYVTLWVAIAGLVLTAITTFIVQLDVLVQGQPWRWTWLARFFSIAMLPIIVMHMWRAGDMARAGALLLVAGWYFVVPHSSTAVIMQLLGALLAFASLLFWLGRTHASQQLVRVSLLGSKFILGAVLAASVVTVWLSWTIASRAQLGGEGLAAGIANLMKLITPSMVIGVVAGVVTLWHWTLVRGSILALVAVVLLAAEGPAALAQWTAQPFTGTNYDAFADWRARIPEDAEVFWGEHLQQTWFLLERRSYLTLSQVGGIVYSRSLADEIVRRALVLEPVVDPNYWIGSPTGEIEPNPFTFEAMKEICRDPELDFVVAPTDFGFDVPSVHSPTGDYMIFLHDCSRIRSHDHDDSPGSAS